MWNVHIYVILSPRKSPRLSSLILSPVSNKSLSLPHNHDLGPHRSRRHPMNTVIHLKRNTYSTFTFTHDLPHQSYPSRITVSHKLLSFIYVNRNRKPVHQMSYVFHLSLCLWALEQPWTACMHLSPSRDSLHRSVFHPHMTHDTITNKRWGGAAAAWCFGEQSSQMITLHIW